MQTQFRVHARNAPRLKRALQDIEAFIGVPGDSDDGPPRYAIVDGYRVIKPLDFDDMPIDYSEFLADE